LVGHAFVLDVNSNYYTGGLLLWLINFDGPREAIAFVAVGLYCVGNGVFADCVGNGFGGLGSERLAGDGERGELNRWAKNKFLEIVEEVAGFGERW
jgi:hypothetical protein